MTTLAPDIDQTIRFSLRDYPSLNPFALDLVQGSGKAGQYLQPLNLERVLHCPGPPDSELVAALRTSNREWGNDVDQALNDWAAGGSASVIAGQQVGFAGGPLLVLSKIASEIKVREELERRGIRATCFFWLATEDHDYVEVAKATLLAREGKAHQIRAEEAAPTGRAVGSLPIPDSLRRQWLELTGLGEEQWLGPGVTFCDSFAQLLSQVLKGLNVVLIDARLPRLRQLGAPLFRQMLQRLPEIEAEIAARSKALIADGYKPQVVPAADGHYSLFYRLSPQGMRQPIRVDEVEADVLTRLIEESPEQISTGALARPLLQDFVFKPAVFVGGPAEIAYYAQIGTLHEMFGVTMPELALRAHVLVAPRRLLRIMQEFSISSSELFSGTDAILQRRDQDRLTRFEEEVAGLAGALESQLTRIQEEIAKSDPTQVRPLQRMRRHFEKDLARLRRRGQRALIRADQERFTAVTRLVETLAAGGVPQDRELNWFQFWKQYGAALMATLIREAVPSPTDAVIAGL
ncbi:MAG TPA: bacillithiol biosynthesis BshC [Thermoanaerobaculia bacterium]|nr:bacillithiol biosynthesis BshC [Thermoanaerobaculia bacterium]